MKEIFDVAGCALDVALILEKKQVPISEIDKVLAAAKKLAVTSTIVHFSTKISVNSEGHPEDEHQEIVEAIRNAVSQSNKFDTVTESNNLVP